MTLPLDAPDVAKASLFQLLAEAKADVLEAKLLLANVIRGNVSGAEFLNYPACDKGCILGTLAIARQGQPLPGTPTRHADDLVNKILGLSPERLTYRIEGYIGEVEYGDTPETCEELAHLRDWLVEWIKEREVRS